MTAQTALFDIATPQPAKRTPKRRRPAPVVEPVPPTVNTTGRTWVITFKAPARMLSVNGNPHWRRTSPIRKTWRQAVYLHAKSAKLPTGLARVRLDFILRPAGTANIRQVAYSTVDALPTYATPRPDRFASP